MKLRKFFSILAIFASLEVRAASIQVLDYCTAESMPALYTVLDSDTQALGGWSYIEKNKSNGEYKSLLLEDKDYRIRPEAHRSDPSCEGEKVQSAILVVKLNDWTRQHSNGLETTFSNLGPRFNDVKYVALDLRVNSSNTKIETQDSLKRRYAKYLPKPDFIKFDQGKVTLGVTLFEKGALDQSTQSFNAELVLEIDQAIYADKWIRLVLPLYDFNLYTQREYQNTEASLDQYGESHVYGFRINPETSNGKQLRNLLGESWDESIPETFKQMSVSIRRISLLGDMDQ